MAFPDAQIKAEEIFGEAKKKAASNETAFVTVKTTMLFVDQYFLVQFDITSLNG